jgi:hypothetical protein
MKSNTTITELSMIDNSFLSKSGLAFVDMLRCNETLRSLHLGLNGMSKATVMGIIKTAESKASMAILCEIPFKDKTITELDVSGKSLGNLGAFVLGHYLKDNMALSSLNILDNRIEAMALQDIIDAWKESKNLKSVCGSTTPELDLSSRSLQASGNIPVVVAELENNLELTVVHVLGNKIDHQEVAKLIAVMKSNGNLKSLCGIAVDQKEVVFKGQQLGPADALMLAKDIAANTVMSTLNLAQNDIGNLLPVDEGWKRENDGGWVWRHTDGREQENDPPMEPKGVIAIANALKVNQTLTHLNLSSNKLLTDKAAGAALAQALQVNSTLKELDVSNNNRMVDGKWVGDGPGFAKELAVGLKNAALLTLNISGNRFEDAGLDVLVEAAGSR